MKCDKKGWCWGTVVDKPGFNDVLDVEDFTWEETKEEAISKCKEALAEIYYDDNFKISEDEQIRGYVCPAVYLSSSKYIRLDDLLEKAEEEAADNGDIGCFDEDELFTASDEVQAKFSEFLDANIDVNAWTPDTDVAEEVTVEPS